LFTATARKRKPLAFAGGFVYREVYAYIIRTKMFIKKALQKSIHALSIRKEIRQ